jgi:hypothetical protein
MGHKDDHALLYLRTWLPPWLPSRGELKRGARCQVKLSDRPLVDLLGESIRAKD